MKFIDFDSGGSGKSISISSDMITLNKLLRKNVYNFINYKRNVNPKINNDHFLMVLLDALSNYLGDTPRDTYRNIRRRLPSISSIHGLVYLNNNQTTHEVLLGKDILVVSNYDKSGLWLNDELQNPMESSVFKLHHHDEFNLNPNSYNVDSEYFSVIGVDVCLLGALQHQLILDKRRDTNIGLTTANIINTVFYGNIANDIVSIALLNRLTYDSYNDNTLPYDDEVNVRNQFHYVDVNRDYIRIRSEYKDYIKQYSRSELVTLNDNLPLVDNNGKLPIATIKDYYSNNLMWINGLLESIQLNRLLKLNGGYELNLNVKPYTRRVGRLLSKRDVNKYTNHLTGDIKDYVNDNMTW